MIAANCNIESVDYNIAPGENAIKGPRTFIGHADCSMEVLSTEAIAKIAKAYPIGLYCLGSSLGELALGLTQPNRRVRTRTHGGVTFLLPTSMGTDQSRGRLLKMAMFIANNFSVTFRIRA